MTHLTVKKLREDGVIIQKICLSFSKDWIEMKKSGCNTSISTISAERKQKMSSGIGPENVGKITKFHGNSGLDSRIIF
jgi:hypothetical protein